MAHRYRASRVIQSLPAGNRFSVLTHLCSEERALWVTRFRKGTQTLGEVIQEVMQLRDARWTGGPKIPHVNLAVLPGGQAGAGAPGAKTEGQGAALSPTKLQKPGRPCLSELPDKTKLCDKFNKGQACDASSCRFAHRCGADLGPGRVCGSWNHAYAQCPCKGK